METNWGIVSRKRSELPVGSCETILLISFFITTTFTALYQGNFGISKAPVSLKDALDKYDIERANSKFGFVKDQTAAANGAEIHGTCTPAAVKKVIPSAAAVHPNNTNPTTTAVSLPPPPSNQRILPLGSLEINNASTHQNVNQSIAGATTSSQAPVMPLQQVRALPQTAAAPTANVARPLSNALPKQQQESQIAPHTRPPSISGFSFNQTPGAVRSGASGSQYKTTPHGAPPVTHTASHTPETTTAADPPPTPMDSLRNSALFQSNFGFEDDDDDFDRPRSSYGKGNHPRNSIGDGAPIQPVPMVTPVSMATFTSLKRPSSESIPTNVDSIQAKRVATAGGKNSNPYYNSSVMAASSRI